jgi:hypothetical protein
MINYEFHSVQYAIYNNYLNARSKKQESKNQVLEIFQSWNQLENNHSNMAVFLSQEEK